MIKWSNDFRKISDLIPAKYNPRKLSDKDKSDLKNSLSKFSLVDPIIINLNNTVIGGHMRLRVLLEQGVTEVDVRVPDRLLSDHEERELNLRLNKNVGSWDESLLLTFELELLIDAGFDGDYIDALRKVETIEDEFNEDDELSKIAQPATVRGDIYLLGDHRLMCGDSREFADVEKLMGGGRAGLIYTDPPYNVDYKSVAKNGNSYSGGKLESNKIFNDNQEEGQFIQWLTDVMRNAFAFSEESANLYCWFAMRNYVMFRKAIEAAGFRYVQVIHWLKERFILSQGSYFHRITEPCFVFYKDWNSRFFNAQYSKEAEVWNLDRIGFEEHMDILYVNRDKSKDYEHPTQKPVRLAERALKRNSEPGMIVLDLFGGSGSSLLCCEQLKRRAYLMELDPKYCDVIIGRWEKFTGRTAVRLETANA